MLIQGIEVEAEAWEADGAWVQVSYVRWPHQDARADERRQSADERDVFGLMPLDHGSESSFWEGA